MLLLPQLFLHLLSTYIDLPHLLSLNQLLSCFLQLVPSILFYQYNFIIQHIKRLNKILILELLLCKPNQVAKDFKSVNMERDLIEKVAIFSNLGKFVCTEGGVHEAAGLRIRAKWKRFKDVAGVLCKNSLSIKV